MSDVTITNAHERIYLNLGEDIPAGETDFTTLNDVTWCEDKQGPHDLEYVRVHPIDPGAVQRRKRRITSEFLFASGVAPNLRTLDALHRALDAMLHDDEQAGGAGLTPRPAGGQNP
ncbi:hypothetical protein [Paraburkholderia youngii]|uniref:hypothetical protein n=1 Tax=Paraburkholderia youngii TaxID=2782701 RepID=UPI003D20153B